MEKIASLSSIFFLHVLQKHGPGSGTSVASHRDALRKCHKPLLLVCKGQILYILSFPAQPSTSRSQRMCSSEESLVLVSSRSVPDLLMTGFQISNDDFG